MYLIEILKINEEIYHTTKIYCEENSIKSMLFILDNCPTVDVFSVIDCDTQSQISPMALNIDNVKKIRRYVVNRYDNVCPTCFSTNETHSKEDYIFKATTIKDVDKEDTRMYIHKYRCLSCGKRFNYNNEIIEYKENKK